MLTDESDFCPICGGPLGSCRPDYMGGLKITTLKEQEERNTMGDYVLQERTYLDASGKATTDPEKANTLLGVAGDSIPEESAKNYGLLDPDEDLEEMSYPDLKAKAEEMGLPKSGSKADLIERIQEAQAAADDDEDDDEEEDEAQP